MAFGLAVYASWDRSPCRYTQDSLPGAGQALLGGLSTRKVPLKGFRNAILTSLPPFPSLLGASLFSVSVRPWKTGILLGPGRAPTLPGLPIRSALLPAHSAFPTLALSWQETIRVPGVDFQSVQSLVPMARVLELLGFKARHRRGSQIHGPCPVHKSQSKRSRSFSVHVATDLCFCHKCGFPGNQIQLWAKVKGITVYAAAIDLCNEAGVDVPWVERW
jgi:hypothetical protein